MSPGDDTVQPTYEIVLEKGQQAIHCRVCSMTSFHPKDVEHRYCGNCHQFHDMMFFERYGRLPLPQER